MDRNCTPSQNILYVAERYEIAQPPTSSKFPSIIIGCVIYLEEIIVLDGVTSGLVKCVEVLVKTTF